MRIGDWGLEVIPIVLALLFLLALIRRAASWPWTWVDNALALAGRLVNGGLDESRWEKSKRDRLHVVKLYLVGVIIILLIPFRLLWHLWNDTTAASAMHSFLKFFGASDPTAEPFILWEVGIFLWSVVFLGTFVFQELSLHAQRLGWDVGSGMRRQLWTFIGFAVLVVLASWLFVRGHGPENRLIGELVLTFVLCCIDVAFWKGYRAKQHFSTAGQYRDFLFTIDLPMLAAFAGLLAYLFQLESSGEPWCKGFVAGAGALNLLLGNTVFAIMFIRERYREG